MRAKRPHDDVGEDTDANPPCGPKQHHRQNQHDEKYEAIFDLLRRVEERSERMEMRAMENKKEAFELAQNALESYNILSE